MKSNIFKISRCPAVIGVVAALLAPVALSGCKEDISEDAYAVKTEQTMVERISDEAQLTSIKSVFQRVRLGNTSNASTLYSVLSARGNYTVFAPTNDALAAYVNKVTAGASSDVNALTYEQAKHIALNCIIDNGSSEAYETADFPTDGTNFALSTLGDRRISCTNGQNQATPEDQDDYYFITSDSAKVISANMEVSNGVLHIVDKVIAPSTKSVYDLICDAGNMKIMSRLLAVTHWSDSLGLHTDEEEAYITEYTDNIGQTKLQPAQSTKYEFMDKRLIKFTAFCEPDEVYQNEWQCPAPVLDANGNITDESWSEIYAVIKDRCQTLLGTTADADDPTSYDNAVNIFVASHLMEGGVAYDAFVHHYNEYGYNYGADNQHPQTSNCPVDVWDYYATMGKTPCLLKVTQQATTSTLATIDDPGGIYLNRVCKYDDAIKGTYEFEKLKDNADNVPGQNGLNIKIESGNGNYSNNAVNGYYYPIKHILVYNERTQSILGSERIRFDITTTLPEFASNDMRGRKVGYFPTNYFKNIICNNEAGTFFYSQHGYSGSGGGWKDYQGDEINVLGRYDFTYQLPPVPADGTYEIRMGISNNSVRGMAQLYFAEGNPNNTQPMGLPIDLRETMDMIPGTPWKSDDNLDETAIREVDRNLRNVSYMKGPKYICLTGTPGTSIRNVEGNSGDAGGLRRILATKEMKRGVKYYIRFKSALSSSTTQLYVDYFEFTPTSVVNGSVTEDVW